LSRSTLQLAGIDLVGAMLQLAQGRRPPTLPAGRAGVRSRQLLLGVLGAAGRGSRRAVLRELAAALRGHGAYAKSVEELTPVAGDPIAAVPVVFAVLATLTDPSLCRLFHKGATSTYSLTPDAWRKILAAEGTAF
jgi:hypothetical protein